MRHRASFLRLYGDTPTQDHAMHLQLIVPQRRTRPQAGNGALSSGLRRPAGKDDDPVRDAVANLSGGRRQISDRRRSPRSISNDLWSGGHQSTD